MNPHKNLPPGVTVRDVSGHQMVDCPNPECDDGKVFEGDRYRDCTVCGGSGEVRKESNE